MKKKVYKFYCNWCKYLNQSEDIEDLYSCENCGRETRLGWDENLKTAIKIKAEPAFSKDYDNYFENNLVTQEKINMTDEENEYDY